MFRRRSAFSADFGSGGNSNGGAFAAKMTLAGGLLGIVGYIAFSNYSAMTERMEQLDKSATYVFNSVSHCMERGFSANQCNTSRMAAENVATGIGTKLYYHWRSSCSEKHGVENCERRVSYDSSDDSYDITYHPYVRGWQASQADINKALPLYGTPDPLVLMRRDGKVFALKR